MFLGPTILLKQILENLIVPRIVAAILGETVEGIVWGRGGGGARGPSTLPDGSWYNPGTNTRLKSRQFHGLDILANL